MYTRIQPRICRPLNFKYLQLHVHLQLKLLYLKCRRVESTHWLSLDLHKRNLRYYMYLPNVASMGLWIFFLSEQLCGFYQPHHPSVPAQHSLWWVHAGHPHHLAGRLHRLTSQGLQAHMHSRMLVRACSAVSVFELCIAFIGNVLESIVIVLSTQVWRCSRLSSKWPPMSVKSWTILR